MDIDDAHGNEVKWPRNQYFRPAAEPDPHGAVLDCETKCKPTAGVVTQRLVHVPEHLLGVLSVIVLRRNSNKVGDSDVHLQGDKNRCLFA